MGSYVNCVVLSARDSSKKSLEIGRADARIRTADPLIYER
jgi:hypothetical protein